MSPGHPARRASCDTGFVFGLDLRLAFLGISPYFKAFVGWRGTPEVIVFDRRLGGQACLFALVILVAAGHLPAGESVPEEFHGKTTQEWLETVRPGQAVRVMNLFGNVHARFGGYEGQVEILAAVQRLETDLPELQVRVSHSEQALDISVGTVDAADEKIETRDRVDLVVFVPQGSPLDVRTEDGLIDAKKLKSEVVASSRTGI